ncbi:dedicator of cytokinesis protein 9-like isoform X3 [Clavelina lepadiformis]|uniref:dedicator of cytokinesis protein 9-like isoform X3 n=1 Tax=Clavelina lepadiformis TaxID=159417 RepID=UPI004041B016
MPETRKFVQGLRRKGTASKRRESASQAVRSSIYSGYDLIKSSSSEPVDYEAFIFQRRSEIERDPQRNLLTFPNDDVSASSKPRSLRTVLDTVPPGALKEASSLMVKECIKSYTTKWNSIEKKYEDYAGDYMQLPGSRDPPHLPEQVYELDEETGVEDDISPVQKEGVTRRGWLYKAPAYGVASISIRSFKRRFFHLKQLPDSSYILNYYKDEKISKDPKGAIYLDSCIGAHMVSLTTKARKHSFEIRMQDQSCHLLSADSEQEATEWINTINQALRNTIEAQVSQKEKIDQESKHNGDGGDLGSVKSSMHPELIKYARETEQKNSLARKESRQNVFKIFPDFQNRYDKSSEDLKACTITPPSALKASHHRIMVACKSLSFNLRGVVIDGAEEPVTNVEPFFVTLSLYDVAKGKKISSDLHVDLNHPLVRRMIPGRSPTHTKRASATTEELKAGEPILQIVEPQWVAYPKQGIFSVTKPHNEIYLVARIEKVLQGSIKSCAQPYMKYENDSHKTAAKVLKHAKVACQRLGHYRMPFAWTAKPLFLDDKGRINTSDFDVVYKQESSKLAEEDLLKFLSDFKKPDKLAKLEFIECDFQIGLDTVPTDLPNILTSTYVPVKPYIGPAVSPTKPAALPSNEPVIEVDEFISTSAADQHPHMEYTNHCYIYPKCLNYDNQKTFTKARNIAVIAEFKDSDGEGSQPLRCFYKRPGPPGIEPYTSRVSAAVLHHHERPEFYEEWKLSLPTQLHHGHHILFSFYHVVVDINAKKKESAQMEVGHAWVPLLTKDGRVDCGVHQVPVAGNLQPGYLGWQDQLNMGKHNSEIKWVDGGKPIFRVNLSLVSSIYTEDAHIHNFFEAAQRFSTNTTSDLDIIKYCKGLLAADHGAIVRYLPTILKQLFYLLTAEGFTGDGQHNCMKTLVHVVDTCFANGHEKLLQQYIKHMFVTAPWKDYKSKTIHEELAQGMTSLLRPSATDFLTSNKLLLHSTFFFEIIVKSLSQHLISTEKIKMKRNERFPMSFQHAVQSLLTTTVPHHIVKKWKTNYTEIHSANLSLAIFVKNCFTYLDRGFVFKLINLYVDNFNPGDSKVLFEMKFEFLRVVCYHEHYIPLNLPFACSAKSHKNDDSWWITTGKSKAHEKNAPRGYSYCLDDEYCRVHFLTGLLIKNICSAMYEAPDVRTIAIETFRNILAKHVFDNRYQSREQQSRISALYLPFLRILLDNAGRLSVEAESPSSRDDLTDSSTPTRGGVDTSSISASSFSIPPIGDRTGSLRARFPDSSLMSAIANPGSSLLSRGSRGSLAVNDSNSVNASPSLDKNVDKNQDRLPALSMTSTTRFQGTDMLDALEIRSLLLCFLHVINNLPSDALHGFWKDSTTEEQIDFFEVLTMCLHHFRYTGKKQHFQGIKLCSLSKISPSSNKSRTLPVRIRSSTAHQYKHVSLLAEPMVTQASHMVDDHELRQLTLLEASLATEVGKIVLDMLAEFTRQYKKQLQSRDGDNPLMTKYFAVLMTFLQIGQSEDVLKHAFASLRLVLCKFPNVLFRGYAELCASLIYHALKACNSRLSSTRSEACALLYLLMRKNYESVPGRNFVRSHLQMIKSVSQLISEEGIGSSRFQHSLSVINNYAISDKGMQSTSFPIEVKDLTKKIRTVLMATAAMKEHKDDPEMLVDLQCSLAKSYAATPELRKTWLESMARVHEKHGNFSEAAMCYIHIAALVAEYLKRKVSIATADLYSGLSSAFVTKLFGGTPNSDSRISAESSILSSGLGKGCAAFRTISPNVEKEESALKEDIGMQDVQYSEDMLIDLLHTCADMLQKAERYELLAAVYNMVIPHFERKRDYERLISIYGTLKTGYEKVTEVNRNGKRLLGTYFRVTLYGQSCFEEEDGKQYIYKEPKLTQLSEISHRLQHMYGKKFGAENVRLIQESGKVNRKELDPKFAYIQVTYVQPYFDEHEREQRRTYFEQQHNVRNFLFETPFTPRGRARGDIDEQWKRKTILTTSHSFPYITKRIPVTTTRSFELKPIEVALDEMTSKCNELEQLITAERVDLKKLQLRLQGSVNVQVNAGPLAYAKAFLEEDKVSNHATNTTEMLRNVYRRFVDLCGRALDINEQLITSNQQVYHESLQQCYIAMAGELSQILHEQLLHDDDDIISVVTTGLDPMEPTLNAISGTPKRSVAGSVSESSTA